MQERVVLMKKGTNAKGVHIHRMDSVKMEFVYCLTKIKKKMNIFECFRFAVDIIWKVHQRLCIKVGMCLNDVDRRLKQKSVHKFYLCSQRLSDEDLTLERNCSFYDFWGPLKLFAIKEEKRKRPPLSVKLSLFHKSSENFLFYTLLKE